MNFELVLIERSTWVASELAYESNTSVDAAYRSSPINLNSVIASIWIPRTQITNISKNEYRDTSLFLYPNGTLEYTAYRHVIVLCRMELDLMPFDKND
jgi:hypothetical protein